MIRVEGLRFSVGQFALRGVDLDVRKGEYFVLLGPSGSGKTLLLECLCGLNRIAAGRVWIGGRDVTRLEPRLRGIGYLPQDYALFPHRTVRQNVAFGLACGAESAAAAGPAWRARRVEEMLGLLGIARLADRYPERLSGGEKQRVALARALAIRPEALLLDEPVSALDEETRDSVLRELRRLQRATGTTALHVCHNFAEMLAVADRAAVIHQGQIVQVGTPGEVLRRPRNALVARFVQSGNVVACRAQRDPPFLRLNCPGGARLLAATSSVDAARVTLCAVRPESIRLFCEAPANLPPGAAVLEGTVRDVTDQGALVRVVVACGGEDWTASLGQGEQRALGAGPGDRAWLVIAAEDVHVMEA